MGVSPMQRGRGECTSESAWAATSSRQETPANLAMGETPVRCVEKCGFIGMMIKWVKYTMLVNFYNNSRENIF